MKQPSRPHAKLLAKWIFAIATVVCLVCVYQSQPPLEKELSEALIGARYATQSIGQFQSPDGLTTSIAEETLTISIQDFETQVDRYFPEGEFLNRTYKENHLSALHRSETEVDYTVDHDIPYLHINAVEMDPSGERATVHYSELTWTQRILERDGTYYVSDSGGACTASAELIKQDGQWKVSQFLDDRTHWPLDSLYVRTMLVNYRPLSEEGYSSFSEAQAQVESSPISLTHNPFRLAFSGIAKLVDLVGGRTGYGFSGIPHPPTF